METRYIDADYRSEYSAFFSKQFAFAQQDTQLGRCAHVAAWVCHRTATLRGIASMRTMAEFSLRVDAAVAEGRPLPSAGLTGLQLSTARPGPSGHG